MGTRHKMDAAAEQEKALTEQMKQAAAFSDFQESQTSVEKPVDDVPQTVPQSASEPSAHKMLNVTVVGAAGGIGQPLSCFLKQSARVKELRLYDLLGTHGVAADLSHLPTNAKISSFVGTFDAEVQAVELPKALAGADVVVISAGIPRKPGMTRQDLFAVNAGIMKSVMECVAKTCPTAFVAIISNPVNSLVPLAAHVLNGLSVYDPRKLCGITQLDVLRARTFVAEALEMPVSEVEVPVCGGHAGKTIVPLLSAASVPVPENLRMSLTNRIQNAGTEVVEAKEGKGSATLSMAVAAHVFMEQVMIGLSGEGEGHACAYVDTTESRSILTFFADQCTFGTEGVMPCEPTPRSEMEQAAVNMMMQDLIENHNSATAFLQWQSHLSRCGALQ